MSDQYSYPDPGDAITYKVIEKFQSYTDYWARSEKEILDHIHEVIRQNGISNYTMLDAGCGEGRLFADFINGASKIVGIEPDKTRYRNAIECVKEKLFAQKVLLLNSTLEESYLHEEFDIVLSSHIIQHIPSGSVENHLCKLADATKDNGLLIINTNVSNRDGEYFIKSYINGNSAVETEIEKTEFDALTAQTGQLPIHMFDRTWIEKVMEAKGFELLCQKVFHIEPEIQRQYGTLTDKTVNDDPELSRRYGRDICFIFRKHMLTKNIVKGALAEFCAFNVKLYGIDKKELVEALDKVKESNGLIIDTSKFCLDECNRANVRANTGENIANYQCVCGDEADKFCSTGQTINSSYRYYIGTTYFNFLGRKTVPLKISVTFFPYRNIGVMCFNLLIKDLSVDEVIVLKQYFGNTSISDRDSEWRTGYTYYDQADKKQKKWRKGAAEFFKPDSKSTAEPFRGEYFWFLCNNLIKDIAKATEKNRNRFPKSEIREYKKKENDDLDVIIDDFSILQPTNFLYPILEINRTDIDFMNDSAERWAERNCKALYGLLVGDEGYKYVPRELALKRISQFKWSTRKFLHIFAYSFNSVMLNFKTHSRSGREYMETEKRWSENYYGSGRNIYFTMTPCVAGIDHGLFRVIERNIIVYYENDYISKVDQSSAINLNKKRNKILLFLYKTATSLDEINDLFNVIALSSGTSGTIESIKQRLSLRSEEKNLKNQKDNNSIILLLTLTSIILGFLAITSGSFFLNGLSEYVKDYAPAISQLNLLVYMFFAVFVILLITAFSKINWEKIAWKSYRRRYKRKKEIQKFCDKAGNLINKSSLKN